MLYYGCTRRRHPPHPPPPAPPHKGRASLFEASAAASSRPPFCGLLGVIKKSLFCYVMCAENVRIHRVGSPFFGDGGGGMGGSNRSTRVLKKKKMRRFLMKSGLCFFFAISAFVSFYSLSSMSVCRQSQLEAELHAVPLYMLKYKTSK